MSRSDRLVSATLALLTACFAGCTNEPGALRMELKARDSKFHYDDPIVLTARLVVAKSPVCLSKAREFEWEIRETSKSVKCAAFQTNNVYCGTGILESMILFPYLWFGAWLDVGDVANRFDVLKSDEHKAHRIEIPVRASCVPGDYEIRVKLNNRRGFCGDFLPLPLFWRLYDQQVSATIPITVVASSTSVPASQPE